MLDILKQDFTDIYGQEGVKKKLKSALLCRRHVIIQGPPGIGKTTLVKNLAKLMPEIEVNNCGFNCNPKSPTCPLCKSQKTKVIRVPGIQRFIRVQGSPDLTVEDLIGDIDPIKALKYGPQSIEAFTPGKIFRANRGVLFFDELNRCPEKLQNSLLQVLEEGYATIGSYDIDIPSDFIFIGTMNPIDSNTEKLSDVLLDRFDIITMSYPKSHDIELKIVKDKGKSLNVKFPENLVYFLVDFVRRLRENKNLENYPSVRASIGLYERAQGNAVIDNRQEVTFDDIRDSILSVLAHRIRIKPSSRYLMEPEQLLSKELENRGDCP